MGKEPVVAELDEGEVPLSEMGAIQDEGLSNGLGLERLLPVSQKSKPKSTKTQAEVDREDEAGEDTGEPNPQPGKSKADTKKMPPKDEKTGRFLKKTKEPELPVEAAKEGDDSDTLKKRLKDTRDWASQVNKKNQELEASVKKLQADQAVLSKKLDGTYVEKEEPAVDAVEMARLTERTKISRALAENLYGVETVNELIYDEGSPYRQLEQADPFVKARVFQADQPVMEALRQLKWKNFTDQYGSDPDEVMAKVREEVTAELVKSFKEKSRGKKTVDDMDGLTNMGGTGERERTSEHPKVAPTNLKHIFPNFPTGHF